METNMPHEKYQSCIDACYACATACDHCAVSFLDEQDVKSMTQCIKLDLDCAEVCRVAASYMARGGQFSKTICRLCAEICQACADDCAHLQMDTAHRWARGGLRWAEESRLRARAVGPKRRPPAPNIKWITASVVPRRVVGVPRNAGAWHRRLDAKVETLTPK